jgi:hypothetical protein
LSYLIPRLQPGDPAQTIVAKMAGQTKQIDPAQVEAIRAMLGTPDGNMLRQYFDYLKNLVQLKFGVSYSYFSYTVTYMIGQAIIWTVVLVGVTQVIGFVAGTLLGAFAADADDLPIHHRGCAAGQSARGLDVRLARPAGAERSASINGYPKAKFRKSPRRPGHARSRPGARRRHHQRRIAAHRRARLGRGAG